MRILSQRLSSLFVLTLLVGSLATFGGTAAFAGSPGKATKISAGGYQGCAITPSQHLECWGDNTYGQLGIGNDLTEKLKPVTVPHLSHVVQVSVGDYDTCVILQGGKLKCFGYNANGEVGDGSIEDRHVPTQVSGLKSGVKNVSVGEYHVCALLDSAKVKCWGYNYYGEVGNGTSMNEFHKPKTIDAAKGASQVSAGAYYTCATIKGHAKCWGYNGDGELGDGTLKSRTKPTQVSGLTSGVKRVSAGYYTTCAVLSHGKLKCWGDNYYGEVGTGTSGNVYKKPVQVVGMTKGVSWLDTDYYFTCVVQNGSAQCWGDNEYNQLGDGTLDEYHAPHQVSGLKSGVQQVDISYYTGCALVKSGAAKCWGWNGEGEVGINSTEDQIATPKTVLL